MYFSIALFTVGRGQETRLNSYVFPHFPPIELRQNRSVSTPAIPSHATSRTHSRTETYSFFFFLKNTVFPSVYGREAFRIFSFWKASLASGMVFCFIKPSRNCISLKHPGGLSLHPGPLQRTLSRGPPRSLIPSVRGRSQNTSQEEPGKEEAGPGERCLIIPRSFEKYPEQIEFVSSTSSI